MCVITFLHPDLGIGGAERLVVDAALALKKRKHKVNIVTTHHNPKRAFEETVNGELKVVVVGDWIPRSIFNRFYALMAYIRMLYAAVYLVFFSGFDPDVVFCDLVSVAVPVLKLKCHVIFYCHYPDQLLSEPKGFLKALYRAPLNWLEEVTLGKADQIFVNSQFTAKVFRNTFKKLSNHNINIMYPSLNMSYFDSFKTLSLPPALNKVLKSESIWFLSINRYERKKNLNLALEAFGKLQEMIEENKDILLVVAGGYDSRVNENVEYHEELNNLCKQLNLSNKVVFLTSISDQEKISLLKSCTCLLYTPSNEHFGIVPIEAMYLGKPVIAVNSGGPTESILDGETGFLCKPNASNFAEAMKKFIVDKDLSENLGKAGRKRVSAFFSFEQFSIQLDEVVKNLTEEKTK